MIADEFRALVDSSIQSLDLTNREEVFAHYQQAGRADLGTASFDQQIRGALQRKAGHGDWHLVGQLRGAIAFQEAFGFVAVPYTEIIAAIAQSMVQTYAAPLSDRDSWLIAIAAARSQIALYGSTPEVPDARRAAVIGAARQLRADGYRLLVSDGGIDFDQGELDRLVTDIDGDVRTLGGADVLHFIFKWLGNTGQFDGTRFTVGRHYGRIDQLREPSVPVAYLVNLAARHVAVPPTLGPQRRNIWDRLCRRSTALCAVYDVEPYNNMVLGLEAMPQNIPRYLKSNGLFDYVFTFRQWSPQHAMAILRHLFGRIDQEKMLSLVGWTIADALDLANLLLEYSPTEGQLKCWPVDQIARAVPAWRRMAPSFVHEANQINCDFLKPTDTAINLYDKPLLRLGPNHLLSLPPSLVAPSFYEAISLALRARTYRGLDMEIGEAIEKDFIPTEARTRGYKVRVNVKYRMFDPSTKTKIDGQCDVILETNDLVLFIEAKKKPPRKISGGGNAFAALCDLSRSLLHGQSQAAKHERLLRHHGHLLFEDGSRLDLNGRSIDRMVLTLLDYGSSQDHTIMKFIYQMLSGQTFITWADLSTNEQKEMAELNQRCQDLVKETQVLVDLGIADHSQRFNLWFLSVPMFLVLLDHAGSPANLCFLLRKLKHATFSLGDPYRELLAIEDLHRRIASECPKKTQ